MSRLATHALHCCPQIRMGGDRHDAPQATTGVRSLLLPRGLLASTPRRGVASDLVAVSSPVGFGQGRVERLAPVFRRTRTQAHASKPAAAGPPDEPENVAHTPKISCTRRRRGRVLASERTCLRDRRPQPRTHPKPVPITPPGQQAHRAAAAEGVSTAGGRACGWLAHVVAGIGV